MNDPAAQASAAPALDVKPQDDQTKEWETEVFIKWSGLKPVLSFQWKTNNLFTKIHPLLTWKTCVAAKSQQQLIIRRQHRSCDPHVRCEQGHVTAHYIFTQFRPLAWTMFGTVRPLRNCQRLKTRTFPNRKLAWDAETYIRETKLVAKFPNDMFSASMLVGEFQPSTGTCGKAGWSHGRSEQPLPAESYDPCYLLYIEVGKVLFPSFSIIWIYLAWFLKPWKQKPRKTAQARRVTGKSPTPREKPKVLTGTGKRKLENGQEYIYFWPTSRPPIDIGNSQHQSIAEAALWCKKAWVNQNHVEHMGRICFQQFICFFFRTHRFHVK